METRFMVLFVFFLSFFRYRFCYKQYLKLAQISLNFDYHDTERVSPTSLRYIVSEEGKPFAQALTLKFAQA